MSELVEVLPQHRFDEARLATYLDRVLPGAGGPLRVQQFHGGQSNPTFLIERAGECCVLRKQPPGPLLPKAHQIDREFRIMTALAVTDVPVPGMLHLCADSTIIGTPFYLMEHVAGRISAEPQMPDLTPSERRLVWRDLVGTLARLHALDWQGLGLRDFGRPDGYAARQVKRWSAQYSAARTQEIPAMDRLGAWLADHTPREERAAIAHGDYRIGNVINDPAAPRIVAVLDWELSTIGHPVADLAYCLMPFRLPFGGAAAPGLAGLDLAANGIPSETELLAHYAHCAGLARIGDWSYFLALSIFRLASIVQGVHARSLQGYASSANARSMGARVPLLAEAGLAVIAEAR